MCVRSPSRMIEPLPKVFSMRETASSSDFILSLAEAPALPLAAAIAAATLLFATSLAI
jgi:hypothetical protein